MAVVDLYKVTWHNSRHNAFNTQSQQSFVVAAAGSTDKALGTLIQTNNGDGQTVSVDQTQVVQKGIIQ